MDNQQLLAFIEEKAATLHKYECVLLHTTRNNDQEIRSLIKAKYPVMKGSLNNAFWYDESQEIAIWIEDLDQCYNYVSSIHIVPKDQPEGFQLFTY
jgi:hypothetical protein